MVSLAKIDETMSTYIKHQTYPLAVKMLSSEDEVPQDAKRPLKDFGASFTLCQAIGLCRRENLTVVLDKESQSCPIALAGLGFVKPDEYLSGKYPLAPMNRPAEAQRKAAESMPRFDFGKFRYILISSILTAGFDPDAIILYGRSAQIMRMIQAAVFQTGGALTSKASGAGGCLLPVVATILEGDCKYTIPGNGERRLGLVADDEVVFAMPKSRFEEVMNGLKLSHEGRQTYPINSGYLKSGYPLPPPYLKLQKALIESSK